jgi:hypothetical protein
MNEGIRISVVTESIIHIPLLPEEAEARSVALKIQNGDFGEPGTDSWVSARALVFQYIGIVHSARMKYISDRFCLPPNSRISAVFPNEFELELLRCLWPSQPIKSPAHEAIKTPDQNNAETLISPDEAWQELQPFWITWSVEERALFIKTMKGLPKSKGVKKSSGLAE